MNAHAFNLEKMIELIVPVIQKMVVGNYAIALGGSVAKGYSDVHSDLDFYVYAEGVIPLTERKALLNGLADPQSAIYLDETIDSTIWGGSVDFYCDGVKVETSIKPLEKYEQSITESLEGRINVEPTFWTISGYYHYICLSEVCFIRPIEDPYGIIADWKKRAAVYPSKLKSAIWNSFWPKSTFWLNNFHYISAINRCDTVYAAGISQQTFHSVVQVLFAVNEVYFAGDKKIEKQLRSLPFCPEALLNELDFLLSAHRETALLEKQRQLWLTITGEISAHK
ncbi:hypothetical protein ACFQZE_04035 [Paenibacillus sp. GCM10027627]|uniref:nucleotidyltransferase domain-containing protein n=1 Tax=unclassified Paenibacillus TaxID=185978 RepID=UPI003625585C